MTESNKNYILNTELNLTEHGKMMIYGNYFTEEEKEFLKEGWHISYYGGWNIHLRQKPINYTGLYYDHKIQEAEKVWRDRQKRKVYFMNSLPERLLEILNGNSNIQS